MAGFIYYCRYTFNQSVLRNSYKAQVHDPDIIMYQDYMKWVENHLEIIITLWNIISSHGFSLKAFLKVTCRVFFSDAAFKFLTCFTAKHYFFILWISSRLCQTYYQWECNTFCYIKITWEQMSIIYFINTDIILLFLLFMVVKSNSNQNNSLLSSFSIFFITL